MNTNSSPLIRLERVEKHYSLEAGLFAPGQKVVRALKEVSLDLHGGETYGLVGESGSGKTTLARCVVQLIGHTGGQIFYCPEGQALPISLKERSNLERLRREVRYVFQDPASSLDPRMSVRKLLSSGLGRHPLVKNPKEMAAKIDQALAAVGLAGSDLDRRPGEFSGGQRQRIALARALVTSPQVLICDEVVSALDVSIQGQILNLLVDLKKQFDLTILFIAHDLTVVSYLADRVGVMYSGLLMEEAPAEALIAGPRHPYTQLLYASIPRIGTPLGSRPDEAAVIPGAEGCPFAPRCTQADDRCRRELPQLRELAPGHRAACFKA